MLAMASVGLFLLTLSAIIKRMTIVYYDHVINCFMKMRILFQSIFFSGTITPRGCGFVIGYTGSNSDDEFFVGDICQVSDSERCWSVTHIKI